MLPSSIVEAASGRARRLAQRLTPAAPALLRATVGLVFVATGWGKLQDLGQVTEFFASLGIPWPALNARVVAGTELLGGALLLVGLATRLAALPLAFTMVIAILTAKRGEIDGVVTLVGFEEWSYLVMLLAISVLGPGALSLDGLLARRRRAPRALPHAAAEA